MGQTKYSRQTWRQSTLSGTSSTPTLGSNGCSLCADGSIPANLNEHVTDNKYSQTCADVHLQLAMLRYDNAMCTVGQEKYEELCCTVETSSSFTSTLAFMVGAVVAGFFLKNVVTNRKCRRIEQEEDMIDDCNNDELPGTIKFGRRGSSRSGRGRGGRISSRDSDNAIIGGTADLEMPSSFHGSRSSRGSRNAVIGDGCLEMPASYYVRMEDPKTKTHRNSSRSNKGRHQSRSRDRPAEYDNKNRSMSQSRGRHESRSRDTTRPVSRSRPTREIPETTRSTRDNRPKSRSRPREMMPETRSTRDRPKSRSRPREMMPEAHSRDSRSKSQSRSRPDYGRPQSRSRSRGRSVGRSRDRPNNSRSRSRTRTRPQVHLPTQVL